MAKTVETAQLIRAGSVEITGVTPVEEDQRPEPGMAYLVQFDTPFDGDAGSASVFVTEARAIELGLVEAPEAQALAEEAE